MSDTVKPVDRAGQADDSARQAGRAFENVGEAAARGTGAATDAMTRTISGAQGEILSKANQELADASRKIIDASRSNAEKMRTLMTLPSAAEGGLQEMQRSVVDLVESVVRTNLTLMEEMFKVKSPQAYVDLQQRFVRDYLDGLLDGMAMLVRAARRTADETLRPLERRSPPE
jgi:hypothetical protein